MEARGAAASGAGPTMMERLQQRPSAGSSAELEKHRRRFALDRGSQVLRDDEVRALSECLLQPAVMANWNQWRVFVGRAALRGIGLVDHQIRSYDYWLRYELTRHQRTIKSITAAHGQRVKRYHVTAIHVLPPTMLADEADGQHINLSGHEQRLTNAAYEGHWLVDVHERTYCNPAGLRAAARPRARAQEAPAAGATGDKEAGRGSGAHKFALPLGWEAWPLESEEIHLRQPVLHPAVMHMSMADRRASGTLRPENFAYEDPHDQGGWFACANSAVFSPAHETLRHNEVFLFPAGANVGGSAAGAAEAAETPDASEPFELRHAKAQAGAHLHMTRAHKLEIRCIHPTRRQRSTSTMVIRMSKYKRTDRFGGQNLTVQMQFLSVSLPPTVLMIALGFTIAQGMEMMRQLAGPHWYPLAFDPVLRKMCARHPPEVVSREDALLYIAKSAEKTGVPTERKLLYAHSFLENEFFPQIGLSLRYSAEKALFLAYVLWRLLMKSVGFGFYDSKDSYYLQRYDTAGILWSSLQRQLGYKSQLAAEKALRGAGPSGAYNWPLIWGEQKLSDQVACCVSKGPWSVNRFQTGSSRTGATLSLKSINYFGYASCVRRSNTANKAHRRSIASRQIPEDQYGRRCAVETPEGDMCGIASFQAVGSTLSVASSTKVLLALLRETVPADLWTPVADVLAALAAADDAPPPPRPAAAGAVAGAGGAGGATPAAPTGGPARAGVGAARGDGGGGGSYWVELDGAIVWRTGQAGALAIVGAVRRLRRAGLICPHVAAHIDGRTVHLCTAPGRNVRLLIVLPAWLRWVQKQHRVTSASPVKEWFLPLHQALREGILEYVDAMEERALSIAFSFEDFLRRSCYGERFSHMEVDPSWMLGVTASTLPHMNHNQSPRSVLGSAMSKQTFSGVINPFRLQLVSHILEYPQRALSQTRIWDDLELKGLCTGQMVDFVIVSTDYSMEDSWEFDQGAHDRGLHKTSLLRRYVSNNKPVSSSGGKVDRVERFKRPGPDCLGLQDANYSKIRADGLPVPGTLMQPEDIIIGRTYRDAKSVGLALSADELRRLAQPPAPASPAAPGIPPGGPDPGPPGGPDLAADALLGDGLAALGALGSGAALAGLEHDDSVSVRDERGTVHSVRSILSECGAYHIKEVILRTDCNNEIGDKYYCRHGQKGTTGLNRKSKDMYFSVVSGKPAMVHMNKIGVLARMTHAHLLELHRSTAAALAGKFNLATAFLSKAELEREIDVMAVLLANGAQIHGYEAHINGMTGQLTKPLLRGIIYQSALAHLVGNKIHARNRGPLKFLTRQPDDGRAKHGGLRFGQMEVDCFAAMGCAEGLVERLKTTSDEFLMPVCEKCGMIAQYSRESGYRFCRPCYSGDSVCIVSVSYSSKLFIQELMAMHVRVQFRLTDPRTAAPPPVPPPTPTPPPPPTPPTSASRPDAAAPAPLVRAAPPILGRADLLNVPRPEDWEFADVGVPVPTTLLDEIEAIAEGLDRLDLGAAPPPAPPGGPTAAAPPGAAKKPRKR
jgi:DNA-directed RNA polymerase subunit B